MNAKRQKHLMRFLATMLAIFILLAGCVIFLLVSSLTLDRYAHTSPSYARVELREEEVNAILAKPTEAWTKAEYDLLSLQTGIFSKEELKKLSYEALLPFQSALFSSGKLVHKAIVPSITFWDAYFDTETNEPIEAPLVELQAGDVFITSSTHTLGYRHGHAALVLDQVWNRWRTLEAPALGHVSKILKPSFFQYCSNFILLRAVRQEGESDADYFARRKKIADDAEKCLVGIPYKFTVGLFSKKDQGTSPKETHCSHLVWQAFKNAGIDIDANGGPICTPRDIARSDQLEIIQVYGFDPLKLW